MFSSPRNGQPIRKDHHEPASVWKCPTCGKRTLVRVKKPYRLVDGAVIPKLDRLQCQACQEEVLDSQAMDVIEKFRLNHPLKEAAIKRHQKALAA